MKPEFSFPGGSDGKASAATRETRVRFLGRKIPWRRKWQSTPVFLPGKSHGQWNLVGYSPWGHKESNMTEQLCIIMALPFSFHNILLWKVSNRQKSWKNVTMGKKKQHTHTQIIYLPWDSPGKSTGVGCHFLLHGIFPTQRLNPGLPHCRQTL